MDKDYFKKYYKTFKNKIIKLTGTNKQNQIADILKVSPSTITRWFAGTAAPALADLIAISQQYHCSIDWLIGNTTSASEHYSVYDICKLFTEIDDYLPFKQQEIKDSRRYIDDIDYLSISDETGMIDVTYSSIYFPDIIDKGFSGRSYAGKEINDFLFKYKGLKEARTKQLIDNDIFHDAVRSQLNKLSHEPIEYKEEPFCYIPDGAIDSPFN